MTYSLSVTGHLDSQDEEAQVVQVLHDAIRGLPGVLSARLATSYNGEHDLTVVGSPAEATTPQAVTPTQPTQQPTGQANSPGFSPPQTPTAPDAQAIPVEAPKPGDEGTSPDGTVVSDEGVVPSPGPGGVDAGTSAQAVGGVDGPTTGAPVHGKQAE